MWMSKATDCPDCGVEDWMSHKRGCPSAMSLIEFAKQGQPFDPPLADYPQRKPCMTKEERAVALGLIMGIVIIIAAVGIFI